MRGSCSNAVLRFEFICNKCQCLLIICFTFGNFLLYVVIKEFFFDLFISFDFYIYLLIFIYIFIYIHIYTYNIYIYIYKAKLKNELSPSRKKTVF